MTTQTRKSRMAELGRLVERRDIGYSQDAKKRWSFLNIAKKDINFGMEGDCSAIAAGIAWAAGYPVNISGTCFTGNLDVLMRNAGWQVIKFKSLSQVRPGDMVLKKLRHVVNVLSDTEWLSAQSNEKGKRLGGQPGDQTGREVVIRKPYIRSGGWDYILRPPAEADEVTVPQKPKELVEDGELGPKTMSRLQQAIGADQTGGWDSETKRKISAWLGLSSIFDLTNKSHVIALQKRIGLPKKEQDGVWWRPRSRVFGSITTKALQVYLNSRST